MSREQILAALLSHGATSLIHTIEDVEAGRARRVRIDPIPGSPAFTREVMRLILRKELAEAFARRGLRRRDWAVELEESAVQLLIKRAFSPTLGARPVTSVM